MKFTGTLFTIIVVCNCFNSINSASIQGSPAIAEQEPRGKDGNSTETVHPVTDATPVTPDDKHVADIQPIPSTDSTPVTPTDKPTSSTPDSNTTTTPGTDTTTTAKPTSTVAPNTTTTTVAPTTTPNSTTTTDKPTTTVAPTTTPNATTTEKPTTMPPAPNNITTEKPPSTTPTPYIPSTPAPHRNRFDGPSFIGGIVLSLGLVAIGFVGWKYYKARTERNYRTL